MQRASEILGKAMRRMDRHRAVQAWIEASWPSIVGAKLATQTRPVRCVDGILEISTVSKEWRTQLEAMTEEFRRRINARWGSNLVREVRFVTAKPGPKRIRKEDDNEHLPFVRSRKPKP